MNEEDKAVTAHSVKNVHKALGMWSIRRALAVAFSGAAVLLVAAWYLVTWMLGSPPKAKAKPLDTSAQLDLLKLVFALVAGVGALVALVTAYRRQRIEEVAGERAERMQAHAERIQVHAEQVARENAHDATERRVTDLYGKAVEQLGHDKAAVRLGGLYALERLAQDHPEHRQTVVDVVCAYLRMPFQYLAPTTTTPQPEPEEASQSLPPDTQGDPRQELQVRLTAQRLLARHLQIRPASIGDSPPSYPDSYWAGIDLDLGGAHFMNLDLSDCRPRRVDFAAARFSGVARFVGIQFGGDVTFSWAQFSGVAWFDRAQFNGDTWFHRAQFNGDTWFEHAQFNGAARFVRAQFNGDTWFHRTQFNGDTWFDHAQFNGAARFDEARSVEDLKLVGATACLPSAQHLWPDGWRMDSSFSDQSMVPLVRRQ